MRKAISLSDVLLYSISVFVILSAGIYLSLFLQVEYQALMEENAYIYFLNSLYGEKLKYCYFYLTGNPKYLFYIPNNFKDLNIERCFTRIETEVVFNYSANLSGKSKVEAQFVTIKRGEVPVFLIYNIENDERKWILDTIYSLFKEKAPENIWEKIGSFFTKMSIFYLWSKINDLITVHNLNQFPESFLKCEETDDDKAMYIETLFSEQMLAVDDFRNLYGIGIYRFAKNIEKKCKKVIIEEGKDPTEAGC